MPEESPLLTEILETVRRTYTAELGLAPTESDALLRVCLQELRETFDPQSTRIHAFADARDALAAVQHDVDLMLHALSAAE